MSLFSRLRDAFADVRRKPPSDAGRNRDAFLVFAGTGEVIRAETMLKAAGIPIRVMGPPPNLRTGCDMVIVCPLIHVYASVQLLEKERMAPLKAVPAGDDLLEPVSLYTVKDYGEWLMVRAANMKVTIRKSDETIVNVSGGGCPDVPYLAALLVGKPLGGVRIVKDHGHTLCGYALDLAVTELIRLTHARDSHEP